MKTKLTLLLALAVSASANAEKPNFNGFKPTASAPAPHSAPSFSGGGSSHSFNAGQAIADTEKAKFYEESLAACTPG